MSKQKAFRHGDVCLVTAKKPTGLKKSTSNVLLLSGSGGNPHTFKGGTWYPSEVTNENYIQLGYLVAKDTMLHHAEHGEGKSKTAKLPNGTYQVRRQVEVQHEGMRVVQD